MLIMVMGLPGSGKTYFARAFSKKIPGIHINSDLVRKELYLHPTYSSRGKASVYQTMFDKVSGALKENESVVVDATFSRREYRKPYLDFVRENEIPVRIILIEAGESTIAQRLQKKRLDSDADFAVYKKIRSEFEPITMDHLVLKSDELSLDEMIQQSRDFINN